MRTRFKVLTAIAFAAVQIFALSSSAFASNSTTYDATKDFATTKKADSVWHYQSNDGSGFKDLPVYYKDWDAWVPLEDPSPGPYSTVGRADGKLYLHPDKFADTGKAINVAISWTAPGDGKVTIPSVTIAHSGNNDPDASKGTMAWIEAGGKKYDETKLKYDGSAKIDAVTLNVKQGDVIRFVANNNGRGGNNTTFWPITVQFDGAAAASTGKSDDKAAAGDKSGDQAVKEPLTNANGNPKTGDSGISTYVLLAAVSLAGIAFFTLKGRKSAKQ
ncbi:LPXTG-motif cell wall-anchored protein [Paenibacillus taihuensis]|uniref:LPXTG-motif cell wall-anchored protein n=1 Tax=Paenibacillus taihuensis TaxID=1156355 RepID=A0A3D9Q0X3_9BACL|nr:LPXTG cell wall anchor domain-containing protein [Paenibacillus taihuensis]REE56455.1 LPXTG-motif cell wall-anchored protein [Paenibacillus taihuensis]